MTERKLIKLICHLRDHVGQEMAVMSYFMEGTECPMIVAASSMQELSELIAEDKTISLLTLTPNNCNIITGIVYHAEDIPYVMTASESAMGYLNGVEIFRSETISNVITRIEYFMKDRPRESMGSMVVVIGNIRSRQVMDAFLNRTKRLRNMYRLEEAGGLA